MPVGTDAVLLGSWVSAENPAKILDIGTGCGLIALILAQRYPIAQLTAIDIHQDSVEEASMNFKQSPWSERLQAIQANVNSWTAGPYDLIVSNPPYFPQGFPISDAKRAIARSQIELSFEQLWNQANKLLTPQGCLAMVLPFAALGQWQQILLSSDWQISRSCYVKAHTHKSPQLVLVEITQQPAVIHEETLCIRENMQYTEEYLRLVRDFYLFA